MQTETKSLKRQWRRRERGVAIFLVIFALLLLSAIAITLIYSTNTETGVNWNYRQEEMAYFAARAGMEEARDRMGIGGQVPPGPTGFPPAPVPPAVCPVAQCLPPAPPGQPGGFVLYLINQGTDPTPVQPWAGGNKYMDDELCHDGYNMAGWPGVGNVPAPGVRCKTTPGGGGWWQTANSNIPWSGTAAAVPYKWVRVTMKANSSVAYGDPVAGGPQNYYSVDPVQAATPQGAAQPVCYDGVTERVPPLALGVTSCAAWANLAIPVYANPVYLVTAMGVTGSGARKVVQAEVGLAPTAPIPDGLFSTSPTCGSLVFSGNGYTDSFNSVNGSYAQTATPTGGDVGTFGNLTGSGNGNIQGVVNVTGTTYTTTVGPCNPPAQNNGVTGSGNFKDQAIQALPANITPASFPPPPAPNPPPPTTGVNYPQSASLPPGTYGNISVSGNATLTLSPGVYNINSLSASGQSNIVVSPLGQVVLNIAGNGVNNVLALSGQDVTNPSGIAHDFLINYAGTGTINLSGQGNTYCVVNAPKAAVNVSGNGQFFGAVLGSTVTYSGNGGFHFDKNSAITPKSNQNYTMLSFREVAY